jgi:hypothetical protein
MRNVNHKNTNFTKYFPKEIMTEEQISALESEEKYSSRGMRGAFSEEGASIEEAARESEQALKKEMDSILNLLKMQNIMEVGQKVEKIFQHTKA